MKASISETEFEVLKKDMEGLTKAVQDGFAKIETEIVSIKERIDVLSTWKTQVEAIESAKKSATNWRDAFLVLLGVFVAAVIGLLTIIFAS